MIVDRALHAPSVVRALLERHGLRPDKGFGQNFLVDRHILEALVSAAGLTGNETVLEVGPGLGVLTRELAGRAGRVVTIELDHRLLTVLEQTVGDAGNVEVVQGDAMEFEFTTLPRGSLLVANLPYNIATPLIARALESTVFSRLLVMVQKEVAERLVAEPATPQYGAVSLLVAHFARARIVRTVSPRCFYPPPEVTSAIVRLDVRTDARPHPELFRLIREAFRHRRKTLAKNLQMAGHRRELVLEALADAGIDRRARGESLGLTKFQELQQRLQAGS